MYQFWHTVRVITLFVFIYFMCRGCVRFVERSNDKPYQKLKPTLLPERTATNAVFEEGHACKRLVSGWWVCGDVDLKK